MASLFSSLFTHRSPGGVPAGEVADISEEVQELDPNRRPNLANDTHANPTVNAGDIIGNVNNNDNNNDNNNGDSVIATTATVAQKTVHNENERHGSTQNEQPMKTPKTPRRTNGGKRHNGAGATAVTPGTVTPARKKNHEANPTPKKKGGRTAEAKAKAQQSAQVRQPPVKAGCRVKVRRSQIFHCLPANQQGFLPREDPNCQNCHGTVVKKSKAGRDPLYDIKLDVFPNNGAAIGIRRDRFRTLKPKEEEPPVDARCLKNKESEDSLVDAEAKDAEELNCEERFIKQDKATLITARTFVQKTQKDQVIEWTILGDDEHITNCKMFGDILDDAEDGPPISNVLDFNMEHGDFFLEHMWPDMTGFGARIDEFHRSEQSEYHRTAKTHRIKIHDSTKADPDWKVKQVVLLIVKGSAVPGNGMEQCWKAGCLPGSHNKIMHPDFGRFFCDTEFKAIINALPFMWGEKACWCRDRRDVPWDVFMPFVLSWNVKQRSLFSCFRQTIVDESMAGWVPKGSKLGGLPNCTMEPRKPVPLGTVLKDTAEGTTKLVVHTDPVMTPSVQDRKDFATKRTFSPDTKSSFEPHSSHVAEVLRQACYSRLGDGCWTGGDAWFGSAQTVLALKLEEVVRVDKDGNETRKPLNVESSFVIKNNTRLFPRAPMFAALRARHPKRMAGHWVVFKATIRGVNVLAIGYAWSNSSVAYMMSTAGNTNCGPKNCTCFDSNCGCDHGGETKQHPRPHIVDFLFRQLPIIDGHNSKRQNSIQIEKCWPTKCAWFKLMNAFVGQSVVNQHLLFSYQHPGVEGMDTSVRDMAATISGGCIERDRKRLPEGLCRSAEGIKLKRVADSAGGTTKSLTKKQRHDGNRSTGSSKQQTCFICKKHKRKHSYSSGACPDCGTCLCMSKRREMSCLDEHLNSPDPNINCNGNKRVTFPVSSRAEDCLA